MNLDISQAKTPGLLRRLAAMLYDWLLLFGVLVVAAAAVIIPYLKAASTTTFPHSSWWFRLYLLAVIYGYYAIPWLRGGQTLGMRSWRFRLLRDDGTDLRHRDVLLRLGWALLSLAPGGAGLLWVLVDRDGLAWHDRLSHTRPVMLRKAQTRRSLG